MLLSQTLFPREPKLRGGEFSPTARVRKGFFEKRTFVLTLPVHRLTAAGSWEREKLSRAVLIRVGGQCL